MEEHDGSYYAVLTSEILYNKTISIRQKVLIAVISNLSNKKGYCWASNGYLAKQLDVDERTIQRDISDLENKKILNRVIKIKSNGDFDFRALTIIGGGMTATPPPPDRLVTTPPDTGVTIITDSINNNSINKDNPLFEKFWDVYDKKVERKDCEKLWSKLKPPDIDKIFEVVKNYVDANSDIKYRKNPATWLRGECWNDVIPIPIKKIQSASERYAHIIENIKLDDEKEYS